jgi:copper chaperone CopZ
MESLLPLMLATVTRKKLGGRGCRTPWAPLVLAGSLALALGPSCAASAAVGNDPAAPGRTRPVTQPVVLQLTGIRCQVCIQSVQHALAQFPGILKPRFDVPREQVSLRVRPGFDRYGALKKAVEAGGGEIQMFHVTYLVPQPLYAALGVRDLQDDKMNRLRRRLQTVPGVRTTFIDPGRWFTNEQGVDVGGAALFVDPDPRLVKNLV